MISQSNNQILIICLAIIVVSAADNYCQQTGTLRGLITDSTSGEVLAFSNVYIEELCTGTSADSRGYFILASLPSERKYNLIVSYIGYRSKTISFVIRRNKITHLDIQLNPASYELQTIEKIGRKVSEDESVRTSMHNITLRQLELLPKGVETDLFRSLQYIAGVQSTSDITANYNVRGSSSNENLILLNGATIYSPFHALGLFSVIDPDIINSAEFYKGGFPTQYGQRLSSVMSIVTKEGNKYKFGGKASTSYLSGKALIEGPIPDGSFLITGRKSYSNEILKKFLNEKDAPLDFYDFSFNINYMNPKLVRGRRFKLFGFFSKDKLDDQDPSREDFEWSNQVMGFKWFQMVTDSPLYYQFGLSWSNFKGKIIPNFSNTRSLENRIRDFTIDADFAYIQASKDEIHAGAQIKEIDTKLLVENKRGVIQDLGSYGASIVVYAKYKMLRVKNFGLEGGTRFNLTRIAAGTAGENFLEPRLSFTYRFVTDFKLKGAWGIYNQEFTTLTNENEVISIFDPWIVVPKYLDPARSIHYILGVETSAFPFTSVDMEAYYKTSDNLPVINERKFSIEDRDLVAAKGESYGLELTAVFQPGSFTLRTSYSLSWAFKEVYGLRYRPRYDSRHNLNIGISYDFGNGWKSAFIWVYHSGLPFTQIAGYYDRLYFQDLSTRTFNFDPYTILSGKNIGVLPNYHRLDFNLSKIFMISSFKFSIDLNIINVYDRKNIFYFERDTGQQINMLPFLPTITLKAEI